MAERRLDREKREKGERERGRGKARDVQPTNHKITTGRHRSSPDRGMSERKEGTPYDTRERGDGCQSSGLSCCLGHLEVVCLGEGREGAIRPPTHRTGRGICRARAALVPAEVLLPMCAFQRGIACLGMVLISFRPRRDRERERPGN